MIPTAERCCFWPFYCEENVYQLCKTLDGVELDNHYVVFISNPTHTVPLWCQKTSGTRDYVIWDYHVILIRRMTDAGQQSMVYDLESTLPFPAAFSEYWQRTMHPELDFAEEYRRRFRLCTAAYFLENFSSDRSHMLDKNGVYTKPPPPWEAPNPHRLPNLKLFMNTTVRTAGMFSPERMVLFFATPDAVIDDDYQHHID